MQTRSIMAPQTTAETQIDQGLRILGPPNPESEKVLTPQATAFVAGLVRRFAPRVVQLLDHRREVQARRDAGERPDFLAETYTDPTGKNPRSRLEGLLSPKEHEMHHRGQLMVIERMLGIVPHLTRRTQERMAARAAASH